MLCDISNSTKLALEQALSVPGQLGLHPYTVTAIHILEQGIRPGVFTSKSVVEYPLTVGGQNPWVRQISSKEIFLSPGRYNDGDYAVGPLVRAYITDFCGMGGTNQDLVELVSASDGYKSQLYFRIEGPGQPPGGNYYQKIYSDDDSALTFTLYIRQTAQKPDLTEKP